MRRRKKIAIDATERTAAGSHERRTPQRGAGDERMYRNVRSRDVGHAETRSEGRRSGDGRAIRATPSDNRATSASRCRAAARNATATERMWLDAPYRACGRAGHRGTAKQRDEATETGLSARGRAVTSRGPDPARPSRCIGSFGEGKARRRPRGKDPRRSACIGALVRTRAPSRVSRTGTSKIPRCEGLFGHSAGRADVPEPACEKRRNAAILRASSPTRWYPHDSSPR